MHCRHCRLPNALAQITSARIGENLIHRPLNHSVLDELSGRSPFHCSRECARLPKLHQSLECHSRVALKLKRVSEKKRAGVRVTACAWPSQRPRRNWASACIVGVSIALAASDDKRPRQRMQALFGLLGSAAKRCLGKWQRGPALLGRPGQRRSVLLELPGSACRLSGQGSSAQRRLTA